MKLFGLVESMDISFVLKYHVPVPHPALFKHLEQYDKNQGVGLELESAKKVLRLPPLTFTNQEIQLNLLNHFKSRGNPVHFLESVSYFKQMVPLTKRLIALQKQIKRTRNEEKAQALRIDVDKLGIELNYMHIVGREPHIIENIVKYGPNLVFLGAAHASRFYRKREELRRSHGIEIEEYWQDEVVKSPTQEEVVRAMGASDDHVSTEIYLKDKTEVELRKIESVDKALDEPMMMHVERLYKAVKEGRVTDGKPDFIGTWDTRLTHRGLFEVFITSRDVDAHSIEGVIEDCNGSAAFRGGTFPPGTIAFTKRYTHAVPQAAKGNIEYECKLSSDGLWRGCYRGERSGMDGFWMKEFLPCPAGSKHI